MIINVTTFEQLQELYKSSAMTWEGLHPDSFDEALKTCGEPGADGYLIKGATMNKLCELTGDNAYPDDLHIFAIKDFKGLAMNYNARWIDDIIVNNDNREGRGMHYHDGENMFD